MGFEIIKSDEIKAYLVATSKKYLFLNWYKSAKESQISMWLNWAQWLIFSGYERW